MSRSVLRIATVLALVIGSVGHGNAQETKNSVAESPTAGRINPWVRDDSAVMAARKKMAFVGWVQPEELGWQQFAIAGLPDAEYKLLSLDPVSGARSQLTRVPAGWKRPQGYHRSGREIFLLSGDLTIGDDRMTKYSYAYYPAGYAQPEAHSEHGAEFLDWWEGEPDFVVSENSLPGARSNEVVTRWNFYEQPWTEAKDFPHWAKYPPPPGMLLKLMRMDKVTGAMTWLNAGLSKSVSPDAYIDWGKKVGGNWEVHPSWEEGIIIQGDLTFGECLPGEGEVLGTYTEGGYFFRPAGIRHVGPKMHTNSFAWVIQRTGNSIWADYYPTCNESPTGSTSGAQK